VGYQQRGGGGGGGGEKGGGGGGGRKRRGNCVPGALEAFLCVYVSLNFHGLNNLNYGGSDGRLCTVIYYMDRRGPLCTLQIAVDF